MISVVIPVYGCGPCLAELCQRLSRTLEKISSDFEIIMVNDHSPDDAWTVIRSLAAKDKRVKGINLARNFGQHYAITAGLDFVQGDWVVVMDCDLQDKPEEIVKLYAKAQQGFDIVFGRRVERKDYFLKRLASTSFHKVYDYFTDQITDSATANFGIFSSKVIEQYRRMREQNRNFALFINWLGYKSAKVDIEHAERTCGKSSYSVRKMVHLAIDGITAYSNKPLRISIAFGFFMSLISFLYGLFLVIRYFFLAVPVPGWTSVMVSMYFLGGLLFANLGMVGVYIGKIFNETKNRPLYLVDETINFTSIPVETH